MKNDTCFNYDISVIMLTFNRESFLPKAIESILHQTMTSFEFIIVDNGSTDCSSSICKAYAEKDSRIKFISKEKGNIGSGRNAGLSVASGRYIAFVDDDDYAQPDMLEFLYTLTENTNADISICGSWKKINNEIFPNFIFNTLSILTGEEAVIELCEREKFNAATPTKLWNRQLFNSIKFENYGNFDDISTVYKLIASANTVALQGVPKYTFIRHEGNNSGFTDHDHFLSPSQLEEYFAVYRNRTIYLSDIYPANADYFLYSEWSFLISMCNKIISNQLTRCNMQLSYIINVLKPNYYTFLQSKYIKDFEKEYLQKYIKELL